MVSKWEGNVEKFHSLLTETKKTRSDIEVLVDEFKEETKFAQEKYLEVSRKREEDAEKYKILQESYEALEKEHLELKQKYKLLEEVVEKFKGNEIGQRDSQPEVPELLTPEANLWRKRSSFRSQKKFSIGTTSSDSSIQQPIVSGIIELNVIEAKDLASMDSNGFSDPYLVVYVDDKKVFKTKIIKKNLNPVWKEKTVFNYTNNQKLSFCVFDWDLGGYDFCGGGEIDVCGIEEEEDDIWVDLSLIGAAHFQYKFTPGITTDSLITDKELTPEDHDILQKTWEKISCRSNPKQNFALYELSNIFFRGLFENCPEAKSMLKSVSSQSKVFASVIQQILKNSVKLSDSDYRETLKDMGKTHTTIGVTRDMYVNMGKSLLSMIDERLEGDNDSDLDETKVVWAIAFSHLAYYMLKGGGDKNPTIQYEIYAEKFVQAKTKAPPLWRLSTSSQTPAQSTSSRTSLGDTVISNKFKRKSVRKRTGQ